MPLEWLPDETLFGLASRHHRISGNRLSEQTCIELFGHRRQGAAHDLPARIDDFVLRTNGTFGDAESIILDHTLLPFYLPFRSDVDANSAINALRSGCLGAIKARLGILASGFGASHPLKSCVICMAEDIQLHNVSFWHLEHQWPGTWVCSQHGTLLRYGLGKVNAEARFDWLLPADLEFSDPIDTASRTAAIPTLLRLSECARGLGRLPRGFHFETHSVVRAYRARLMELGLAKASGRLRLAEFEEVLSRVCVPLSSVYGLSVLSGDAAKLSPQFARLAHDSRPESHPLRHLVLIVALFDSWGAFLKEYNHQSANAVQDSDVCESPPAPGDAAQDPRSTLVVQSVGRGLSVTAAARRAGVAVGTAMAWLAKAGGQVRRRPKKLRAELRGKAIARLRKGEAKRDVADAVGVSIQAVTRLLSTEAALSTEWNRAKFVRRQRKARAAWARTARKLKLAHVKSVRAAIPADFAWLYRNDRVWLECASRALTKIRTRPASAVNWEDRDRELAMEVGSMAMVLRAKTPGKRITVSELCNSIPKLKPLLSKLNKMPLTRSVIQTARSA